MKNLKNTFSSILLTAFLFASFSCSENPFPIEDTLKAEEESMVNEESDQQNLRIRPGGSGDIITKGGEDRVPYPTIIKQTFIPRNTFFAHKKTLAWRIIWPEYNGAYNQDLIPTVFTRGNGALNSFNYLNNTDPFNTLTSSFSLFLDDKVEASINMGGAGLDHVPFGGVGMEWTYFAKTDQPVHIIEGWVKERPSLFETYFPLSNDLEYEYNAGDIILFKISGVNLYGGIRIVSMSPRIIEVYLAVPNG